MLTKVVATILIVGTSSAAAFSDLGWVALVASAFFVVLAARASQSRKELTDSLTALQGRLAADQDEIRGLQAANATQAALIKSNEQQLADLRASIRTLERVVTGRDAIAWVGKVLVAGFTAQGVDKKVLDIPFDSHQPEVKAP